MAIEGAYTGKAGKVVFKGGAGESCELKFMTDPLTYSVEDTKTARLRNRGNRIDGQRSVVMKTEDGRAKGSISLWLEESPPDGSTNANIPLNWIYQENALASGITKTGKGNAFTFDIYVVYEQPANTRTHKFLDVICSGQSCDLKEGVFALKFDFEADKMEVVDGDAT